MNIITIFGYCFIFEIALIVSVLIAAIFKGYADRKEKERTYKHMLKYEEKLRNKKSKTNLQEIVSSGKFKFKLDGDKVITFNEKDEQIESIFNSLSNIDKNKITFKIIGFSIKAPDDSSVPVLDVRRSKEDFPIPDVTDPESKIHILYGKMQIPYVTKKSEEKITETIIKIHIDFEYKRVCIYNEAGNLLDAEIIYLETKESSKEETQNDELKTKIESSPELINEILEGATTEGYKPNES